MKNIELVDIRGSDLVNLLDRNKDKALNLINASKNSFGMVSRLGSYIALPIGDYLSHRWLQKTRNPYLNEIEQFAKTLAVDGIFALNLCYEWGCTSGVYSDNDSATLTRILDWPFPGLGENIVVANQTGKAGSFYNVTWPGVSGVFNAMAPGRFAATLNQAPMRRYKTGIFVDWARNRIRMGKATGLPPAHLLRKVFETAANYQEAKSMLSNEPISIPVIYVLSGMNANEGCVIERLENDFVIHELQDGRICAANHFESRFNGIGYGWLPRGVDSHGRAQHKYSLTYTEINNEFNWFKAPIANHLSRLAIKTNAATGSLEVIGTAGEKPVTYKFSL